MRKAIAMLPVVSAIYPMITGVTAPPTIVMISNEEASLVFVPAHKNFLLHLLFITNHRVFEIRIGEM